MGMQTMDQALAKLYSVGLITRRIAEEQCIDRKEMERLLDSKTTLRSWKFAKLIAL